MPFVFIAMGLLLLVVALRGTQDDLFKLVQSEISGPGSFPVWALAIIVLGAIGYIKPIRPISDGLVLLVLLVIVIRSDNIFGAFNTQVSHPTAPAAANASAANTGLGSTVANGAWNMLAHPLTTLGGAIVALPSNVSTLFGNGVPNAQ